MRQPFGRPRRDRHDFAACRFLRFIPQIAAFYVENGHPTCYSDRMYTTRNTSSIAPIRVATAASRASVVNAGLGNCAPPIALWRRNFELCPTRSDKTTSPPTVAIPRQTPTRLAASDRRARVLSLPRRFEFRRFVTEPHLRGQLGLVRCVPMPLPSRRSDASPACDSPQTSHPAATWILPPDGVTMTTDRQGASRHPTSLLLAPSRRGRTP
jgi:hypothetical protein